MTREIKFRAWEKEEKVMCCVLEMKFDSEELIKVGIGYPDGFNSSLRFPSMVELMQYTGLKDKNGLQEVYEGDIIDTYGNIKGNIHQIKEVDKDRYDLVIQGFGTKDWLTTYQNAVDRGCKDSE